MGPASSKNLYGNQLRAASCMLEGFYSVLGRQLAHDQGQLAVSGHLHWRLISPLHVLGAASTATHFHDKLGHLDSHYFHFDSPYFHSAPRADSLLRCFERNRLPREGRSGSSGFVVFSLDKNLILRWVAAVASLPSARPVSDFLSVQSYQTASRIVRGHRPLTTK